MAREACGSHSGSGDGGCYAVHAVSEPVEPVFESVNTVDQASFARWVVARESWDPQHYELLNGRVVVMAPAHYPHGAVEARLCNAVYVAAESAGGMVFGSSQGFELATGDTVEPDVSWVSAQRWVEAGAESGAFLRFAPDLVIEVLSPSTAVRDRGEKRGIYEAAGVREYWLIDVTRVTVTVFCHGSRGFDAGRVYGRGETVRSQVLPPLVIAVDRVCSAV
jgi:Uma2 family endonuclease